LNLNFQVTNYNPPANRLRSRRLRAGFQKNNKYQVPKSAPQALRLGEGVKKC